MVLADTGFASGPAVADLQAPRHHAAGGDRTTPAASPLRLPPPPKPKTPHQIAEPWRVAMKAKLQTEDAKALHKKRKNTVEPVFGIIKSAMGFVRFRLRGLSNVASEWTLITLVYNCRRLARLQAA
jgi:hypothetical protein